MDIEWISDFLELASTKSFTVAAKNRNRSQPAFSRRISALEQWIGATLIDRTVHPFALTKEGRHFRKSSQVIINDLLRTRDECRQGQSKMKDFVRFTALHTLAINYFASWMSEVHLQFRPIHSKVHASNLHDCVESIQSGQSEFMLSYSTHLVPSMLNPSDFLSCVLTNDQLILVSATDDRGKAIYSIEDSKISNYLAYSSNCLMGKLTEKIIETNCTHLEFNPVYENSIAEAVKAMAIQGLGVGWLPSVCITKELARGDLVNIGDESMTLELDTMLYRSKQRLSNEAESIWAFLNKAK